MKDITFLGVFACCKLTFDQSISNVSFRISLHADATKFQGEKKKLPFMQNSDLPLSNKEYNTPYAKAIPRSSQ